MLSGRKNRSDRQCTQIYVRFRMHHPPRFKLVEWHGDKTVVNRATVSATSRQMKLPANCTSYNMLISHDRWYVPPIRFTKKAEEEAAPCSDISRRQLALDTNRAICELLCESQIWLRHKWFLATE